MARTATPAIEREALKAKVKSEGMRMLYSAGYSVARVAKIFNVGYPFAYGVAQRAGVVATAAKRRAKKAAPAAKKATTRTVAAPKRTTRTKAAPVTAAAKKPGRPTAARRTANRKAKVAAK